MLQKDTEGIANNVDNDQTAPHGLHCLLKPICPKVKDTSGTFSNITHQFSHYLFAYIVICFQNYFHINFRYNLCTNYRANYVLCTII